MGEIKPVIEEEVQPVILDNSDFDSAFADAVADKPQTIVETVEPVEPIVQAEAPAATAEEPPAPEENVTPSATPAVPDYQNELATLRAELEAMKAASKGVPEEPAPESKPEPIYTPEQETAIAEFRKEWPEVAAGIDLLMQGFLKQTQQSVLQQVFDTLTPALTPVMELYQDSATDRQYATIKATHADYDEIYDDVLSWIKQQPDYLRGALQRVATEGSAAEVVDMIGRYKTETGKVTQTPSVPKVTDLPETAKKAARSLGVVSSKRSAVPQSQDPSDFDGAWAEAMNG